MTPRRGKPVVRASPRWNRFISLKAFGILIGTTVLMFGVGYLIAVRILFPPLAEPENGIVVPDVAGQSLQQAQQTLREVGLRVTEVMDIEHPTQPIGVVTAQSPIPGQQLRELGAVRLSISAGVPVTAPRPVPVPDTLAAPDTIPTPEPIPAPGAVPPDSVLRPDSVSFSH